MNLKILILLFNYLLLVNGNQVDHITWKLDALDCRKSNNVKTGLLTEVCDSTYQNRILENLTATIITKQPYEILKVYTCSKFVSTVRTSCSPINGSEILLPPDILKQVAFPEYKCQGAVDDKEYTTEDGRKITLQTNNTYQYKYVQQSTLKVDPAEASCQGDSVTLGITRRTGMISLVEVSIYIQEIYVDKQYHRLDNQLVLPKRCFKHSTCTKDKTAFYIPTRTEDSCSFKQVKEIKVQKVITPTIQGDVTIYLSEDERVAIVHREEETIDDANCPSLSKVVATQYPDIKLVLHKDKTGLEYSTLGNQLQWDMTAHYLEFTADSRSKETIFSASKSICELTKPLLNRIGRSPFNPNSLVRVRGEVIQEIQCTTVVVEARKGDKHGDLCTSDLLPVWLDFEPVYLQANTRMIMTNMVPNQIDCAMRYSPIFLTNDGSLIKAKPEIQDIQITLNQIDATFLNEIHGNFEDPEESYDKLQRKPEELLAYQDYIYHQQAKENVLQALVHKYCQSGECGDYKPIQGSGKFKLSNLNQVTEENWNFTKVAKILNWIGSYCSIIVLLYIILSFFVKIINIGRLICFERVSTSSAIRLNFLVSQQLSNILLYDDPRNRNRDAPTNENREVIQLIPQPTIVSDTRRQPTSNRQNYTVDRRWYN